MSGARPYHKRDPDDRPYGFCLVRQRPPRPCSMRNRQSASARSALARHPRRKARRSRFEIRRRSLRRSSPLPTTSILTATPSVSSQMTAMVGDIESAAGAVSSTADVIAWTVCACASTATRMRSAKIRTSFTIEAIEAFISTVPFVADWMAAILPAIPSVARAVWETSPSTSRAERAKPRQDSHARAVSMVAWRGSRLVRPRDRTDQLQNGFHQKSTDVGLMCRAVTKQAIGLPVMC